MLKKNFLDNLKIKNFYMYVVEVSYFLILKLLLFILRFIKFNVNSTCLFNLSHISFFYFMVLSYLDFPEKYTKKFF